MEQTMPNQPPLYIIGSGAIGKALAATLSASGRKVYLVKATANTEVTPTVSVSLKLPDGNTIFQEVQQIALADLYTDSGVCVITAKSYANEMIAEALHQQAPVCPIVLLQNGLDVEAAFTNRDFPEVYRCVLFATSQPDEQGNIIFRPVTDSVIGIVRGDEQTLNNIVALLHNPFFSFRVEPDIQQVIWKKAIVNSVYNSVCPLLETDNGIFHRNETVMQVAMHIVRECLMVAAAYHIRLSEQEVQDTILNISRHSDGLFISTLQDMRHGRQTEIDTLNFAINRLAVSKQLGHCTTTTGMLGELTRVKAALCMKDKSVLS
jgi:2-dehydropantoate 2-reductase